MIINSYAFGGAPPVYATWNPADKSGGITLSAGNRTADTPVFGGQMVRATKSISGKRYFECTFTPNGDGVGPGWASTGAGLNTYLGGDTAGYGHYLPGNDVYNNGSVVYAGATNSTSPVTVGFALDSATRRAWIIVQGGGGGFEGGGDPAANTAPTLTLAAGTYFPACTPYTGASVITINAGQSAFTLWTPSGGYSGVS